MEATRRPVDFDTIQKGSVIPASDLETIFGVLREHRDYAFNAMQLCARIEEQLRARGVHVIACLRNGDIRVLTDEEAVGYTEQQNKAAVKRVLKNHNRSLRIDQAQLSADAKAKHDRHIFINSRVVGAMLASKRDAIKLLAHKPNELGRINGAGQA